MLSDEELGYMVREATYHRHSGKALLKALADSGCQIVEVPDHEISDGHLGHVVSRVITNSNFGTDQGVSLRSALLKHGYHVTRIAQSAIEKSPEVAEFEAARDAVMSFVIRYFLIGATEIPMVGHGDGNEGFNLLKRLAKVSDPEALSRGELKPRAAKKGPTLDELWARPYAIAVTIDNSTHVASHEALPGFFSRSTCRATALCGLFESVGNVFAEKVSRGEDLPMPGGSK